MHLLPNIRVLHFDVEGKINAAFVMISKVSVSTNGW
jgi:hypothetical protein